MGVGDLSFSAVASLKSIDTWIATLNSNMAGAGRVGYKATRVKFTGGAISTERPVVSPRLGIMVAEQSLGIAQTSIDFSQGAIAASTDFTHLGIQRTTNSPGMFVLNTLPSPTGVFPAATAGDEYYTFDGEFHLDPLGRLVNSDGLFVMSNGVAGGQTDNNALGIDTGDIVNDAISLDRLAIATWPNPQLELKFSRFGATTFERVNPTIAATIATVDAIGNYTSTNGAAGRVIPNALEASNASLTQSVPELALAQKMYSALAKVIQVALANIDTALALGPR